MEDDLKRYTQQHRQEFEVYRLNIDDAWHVIEERLRHNRMLWKDILKVAAILLAMVTIAFGYYLNDLRMEITKSGIALTDLSSELADTEAYYALKIDEKLEMIRTAKGSFDPGLLAQLEDFEEDYRSLKKDLKDNADSEEVINAMIGHYRLKLKLLEKIYEEIEKDHDDNDELQAI